jgi:hypothetical protein
MYRFLGAVNPVVVNDCHFVLELTKGFQQFVIEVFEVLWYKRNGALIPSTQGQFNFVSVSQTSTNLIVPLHGTQQTEFYNIY